MRFFRWPIFGVLVIVVVCTLVTDAGAIRFQQRPNWMVSVGMGMGRGSYTGSDGVESSWRNGATPTIRFGRMIGAHFMAGLHYGGWTMEFGDLPVKTRRSMQNLSLALAWFPGKTNGASGGLYLRAGGGVGWGGVALVEVKEEDPLEHGIREDEFGFGAFGETGYEFWISHHFTAGLGVSFTYLNIGETLFDTAWFSAALLNLNLYF